MPSVLVQLTAQEIAVLRQPVNGTGGFQTLMLKLQAQLGANGSIQLSDAQLGRVVRYAWYAQGGFQNRFKDIFGRAIGEALAR